MSFIPSHLRAAWRAISRKWISGIDFTDPKVAKARVVAEFDGWVPERTALSTDGARQTPSARFQPGTSP